MLYELVNRDTGARFTMPEEECIKLFGAQEWREVLEYGGDGQYLVSMLPEDAE